VGRPSIAERVTTSHLIGLSAGASHFQGCETDPPQVLAGCRCGLLAEAQRAKVGDCAGRQRVRRRDGGGGRTRRVLVPGRPAGANARRGPNRRRVVRGSRGRTDLAVSLPLPGRGVAVCPGRRTRSARRRRPPRAGRRRRRMLRSRPSRRTHTRGSRPVHHLLGRAVVWSVRLGLPRLRQSLGVPWHRGRRPQRAAPDPRQLGRLLARRGHRWFRSAGRGEARARGRTPAAEAQRAGSDVRAGRRLAVGVAG
jgi:hypothetical protein